MAYSDADDENIYEEIREKSEESQKSEDRDSGKSSSASQEIYGLHVPHNSLSAKSKFQKAFDAVTRKSGRSLDAGSEKSFHLSISKGRKKSLIDRAHVDWDCEGEATSGMVSKLNKSHNDMFGDINASHNRVMSQLNLDVEVIFCPAPLF